MAFLTRITQILSGKNLTPQTDLEAAVKQAVANAGGGAGGLIVNFTLTPDANPDNPPTVASDAAVADIYAALVAGKYVVGVDGDGAGYVVKAFDHGFATFEGFDWRLDGVDQGETDEWAAFATV